MAREKREVWAKRVQRWADSRLTAKEFASETGVNENTLAHCLDIGRATRCRADRAHP
jgi:hypothetical protein